MQHTIDEARYQTDAALAACSLDSGSPCASCREESDLRARMADPNIGRDDA